MVDFKSGLLDIAQHAVQGVSTVFPTLSALDELGSWGNGTGQRRSSDVSSVVAKPVFFTDAQGLGLQRCKMRLDPSERYLAEKQPPEVPVLPFEEGGGASVANATGEAEGQVLGVNDGMSLSRAPRHPNNR